MKAFEKLTKSGMTFKQGEYKAGIDVIYKPYTVKMNKKQVVAEYAVDVYIFAENHKQLTQKIYTFCLLMNKSPDWELGTYEDGQLVAEGEIKIMESME